MYQVIEIYGDSEPWWFFDDWRKDIVFEKKFNSFQDANEFFRVYSDELSKKYKEKKQKGNYLIAFWNEADIRYCEECEEDLQQYKGLLLLKNDKKISTESDEINETIDYSGEAKCCKRFGKGIRSETSK